MTITEIKALIPELVSGRATAATQDAFEKWLKKANSGDLSEIMDEYYDALDNANAHLEMPTGLAEQFEQRMRTALAPPRKRALPIFRVAAAVIGIISLGAIALLLLRRSPAAHEVLAQIEPGSDKAMLTLANGQRIMLGTGHRDSTIQTGVQVIRLDSSVVSYNHANAGSANAFNTLTTPRGGQFQIILPDGSHVWLNAVSSLRYPVSFAGEKRSVELTGQAYFEVAPSIHPFIVKTGKTEVQVLGTSFDVMAYPEEESVKTTLISGSVAVATDKGRHQLAPGEQAIFQENTLSVAHPSLEEVTAWKDGEFRFNGVSITAIMRQLSRWYDVDIRYEGPVPTTVFSGTLSRKQDVRDLLNALEITETAHFRIEEKTIVVRR